MALNTLFDKFKAIIALDQVSGLVGWDQETMMASGSANQRATQQSVLAALIHEKVSDPEIGQLINDIDIESLDYVQRAHVNEMRSRHQRAVKIPVKLATDIAETTSKAIHVWAKARQNEDYAAFAPTLKQVLALRREEAACLREPNQSSYDALLNDYEPGANATSISALFDELQPALRELRGCIAEKPPLKALEGQYPEAAQMALVTELAKSFGYSFDHGRLDLSVHPFSSGNFDDTRITTRVDEADPLNCIYSTIHETGHAMYEHGISRELMFKAAGCYASMGVHESQSRFFENQIGRSRAYMNVLQPLMVEHFPDVAVPDADTLYQSINRVSTGFIRTEADEVHYNLHVILRFNLEQDLINGDLDVQELEQEWNTRFARDFGLEVPAPSKGVLQDVHWSHGLMGYFPTYALGNIYSACLNESVRKSIPDLDKQVSSNDNAAWVKWMRSHVHQHGRCYSAHELVERATGEKVSTAPLVSYLNKKFGELYSL